MATVTKDMIIEDIIGIDPNLVMILMQSGNALCRMPGVQRRVSGGGLLRTDGLDARRDCGQPQ